MRRQVRNGPTSRDLYPDRMSTRRNVKNDNSQVGGFDEQSPPGSVSIDYEVVSKVNFASAQNDVAIIQRLAIDNPTDEPLVDVRVTLRAAPSIVREKIWSVDRIAPSSELPLRDLSTPLDIERLAGLDEAEIGEVEFRVEAQGTETIVEKCRIELLARDEWGGVGDMAQILAAFVSPNDRVVAGILKEAARLLQAAGHDGSINGYQSGDPRRVYLLAGAIWSALTGLGLAYAVPPASFELHGQKIRTFLPRRTKRRASTPPFSSLTATLGSVSGSARATSVM